MLPTYNNYNGKFKLVHDLNITKIDITINEVFIHLNLNLASCLDGISLVFFRSCNYIISRILWILFNKLSSGIFLEL